MTRWFEEQMGRWLIAWVDAARRNSGWVIVTCLGVTLAAAAYAAFFLGINSDNVRLISADLPSRQNHEAFAALFPNLDDALLVVVDGETPELAREAARALLDRLADEPEYVETAYLPGGGDFFEIHGLLYRSPEELDAFADQMARLQPILAALEIDPSVSNLASLVEMGLEQVRGSDASAPIEPERWSAILESVGKATVAVYTEFPLALSWEELLLRGSAVEVTGRQVIVVHPVLDFGNFLAAGRVLAHIRSLAAELGLTEESGVRVRMTGNPALNYEEMIGLGWDLGLGGIVCFFFVIAVLTRALRSLKLVMAAVITLLTGLVWSAAYAAATVGHVSLVSASFAVLFIGLGVDFAIHLGMAYADQRRRRTPHEEGLRRAIQNIGGSLLICTITTAIGFFVFVPTDYLGVAELGLIAGGGMFIIFFLTLTLMPALLSRWLLIESHTELAGELHFRTTWWRVFDTYPGTVLILALAFGVLGGLQLPRARFDVNVIEMRDPTTESVQAFTDLLADSGTLSPWFLNSVAEDFDAAEDLVARMEALESVSHTLTLRDYVPLDQEEKLEILSDLGYLLDTPPLPPEPSSPADLEKQIASLHQLQDYLNESRIDQEGSDLHASVRILHDKLADFLIRVEQDPNPRSAIEKLDELLLSGLPDQMNRLRRAIETQSIVLEELPEELSDRMISSDGQVRVQIFPMDDLSDEAAFIYFTDQVKAVDPRAAGVAMNLVGFGRATRSSFEQALLSAIAIIAVILLIVWRRIGPVLLVMAPLLLSAVLTVAAMVVLGIPFNFANVIVIPLMLGIGVDSGIHLVHRAEAMADTEDDLMDSSTARAVFYSALTTLISFGTLAFSSHHGVESLGIVLSIGMVLTVISNLVVLPSLLRVRSRLRSHGR
ncbi:MAG: MMPL family transporter [Myxococcota bacterium]